MSGTAAGGAAASRAGAGGKALAGTALPERWLLAWKAVAATPRAGLFDELVACYAGEQRHYHSLQHLHECFEALDAIEHRCERPAEVALGLFFHDAIHEPTRHDSEERSAQWAMRELLDARADPAVAARVAGLVRASAHQVPPRTADERVLLDCDLRILAAAPPRFDEYEAQVRLEYAHVDDARFGHGRLKLLRAFAARERLFHTPEFARLEASARGNLARSIDRLEAAGAN